MSHFDSLNDAADFLIAYMHRNDYFHDFSDADRIMDPDGIYDIESTMTDVFGDFTHGDEVREALALFDEVAPAERLEAFERFARRTGTDCYGEVIRSLKASV